MIDFHSHILPGIDDGSHSVEESVKMLTGCSERITDVCLTPHFYPSDDLPEAFLSRRQAAFEQLEAALEGKQHPQLHLGAEVLYFDGIYRSAAMEDFKIQDSRLILIEMPMGKWTMRMMDQILELNRNFGLRPVLAHIDRYQFASGNSECLSYFLSQRGLVQVNADAALSFWSRRKMLSMARQQMIHFIGSDAHNLSSRKPNVDEAIVALENAKAADVVRILEHNSQKYFYHFTENPQTV